MAKPADALDSDSNESNFMQVQILLRAPKKAHHSVCLFWCVQELNLPTCASKQNYIINDFWWRSPKHIVFSKISANPVTCTKKFDKLRLVEFFYPSHRLGMESRVSVYVIAVGVWHHQGCIFLRLDSIRLLCNQFHTATSCGFHPHLLA